MKKRLISLLLMLCLVAALAAGCGGSNNEGGTSTTAAPQTESKIVTTTEAKETVTTSAPSSVITEETYVLDATGNKKDYTPLNYKVTKGVWLSQWDASSIFVTRNIASFKVQMRRVLKTIQEKGFNTLIVQVRPYGDSYYPSEFYPESKFINGVYGQKKDFDPLKELIALAHEKGVSVHAWINPLRLMNSGEIKDVEDKYLIRQWFDDPEKNGDYIVEVTTTDETRLYLNPAHEEVRQLIIDGAEEICKNYDIDALHMDDYFYPTTAPSFDAASFAKFTEEDGSLNLPNWRRENVNMLVRGLYECVKAVDGRILFGISPAGDINSNTSSLYADVKTWCSEGGYIDYICPQLYWSFNDQYAKFETSYNSWARIVTNKNIKLMVGLALYKAGTSGEWKEDPHDIIKREIETLISNEDCDGIMVFSYQDIVSTKSAQVAEVDNFVETLKNWK